MQLSGVGFVYERKSMEIHAKATRYHYEREDGSDVSHLQIQLPPDVVAEVSRRRVELVVMTEIGLGIPFLITNASPIEVEVAGAPFDDKRF